MNFSAKRGMDSMKQMSFAGSMTAATGGGGLHHPIVSKNIFSLAANPASFSGPQHTTRRASSLPL